MKRRLYFDLETSKMLFWAWDTGKTYLRADQIIQEKKIVSFHWKWEGEEEVHHVHWGLHEQCDKKVVQEIAKQFSRATEIVSHNGKRFDMKIVFGRAMFHKIDLLPKYIQRDTYQMVKSVAYLPSYSLKYCCKHFGLPLKLDSGGSATWDKVQFDKDQEALDHLLYYGDGDIISLEALFNHIKPFFFVQQHYGEEKYHCPECDLLGEHNKRYTTAAGTVQHYFRCKDKGCNTTWKVNNKVYQDWLQYKIRHGVK